MTPSELLLGWKRNVLDRDGGIWKKKRGKKRQKALIRVSADSMARNSLIVAQSGSGKSFFLGLLIEEILLVQEGQMHSIGP